MLDRITSRIDAQATYWVNVVTNAFNSAVFVRLIDSSAVSGKQSFGDNACGEEISSI